MSAARHEVPGDLVPDGLAPLDRGAHRRRAPEQRRGDPSEQVAALVLEARGAGVLGRLLPCLRRRLRAGEQPLLPAAQPQRAAQPLLVAGRPEHREHVVHHGGRLRRARSGAPRLMPSICCWTSACDRASSSPAPRPADTASASTRSASGRRPASISVAPRSGQQRRPAGGIRRHQRHGPLEQTCRGPVIASPQGPPAGRLEPLRGARGERGRFRRRRARARTRKRQACSRW